MARTRRDPDGDVRRALDQADRAARLAREAENTRLGAILFAHQLGASLREIAEATGIPHATVARMIKSSGTT